MDTGDLLSVKQAAEILGIHHNTVYQAMDEKRLPYVEVLGRKAVQRADVEAYLQRSRPNGVKPRGRPKKSTSAAGQE